MTTTTVTPDIPAILREAANVLRCNGWHQGDYVNVPTDWYDAPPPLRECPVCAYGAINIAAGNEPNDEPGEDDRNTPAVQAALALLRHLGLEEHPIFGVIGAIGDWNDDQDRLLDEVLRAFEDAARAVSRSWGHALRRMPEKERKQDVEFGFVCGTNGCADTPTHVGSYKYVTGRAGRVALRQTRLCPAHATKFAARWMITEADSPATPDAGFLTLDTIIGALLLLGAACWWWTGRRRTIRWRRIMRALAQQPCSEMSLCILWNRPTGTYCVDLTALRDAGLITTAYRIDGRPYYRPTTHAEQATRALTLRVARRNPAACCAVQHDTEED